MTTQHDKAKRSFTVSELLVYISLFCLSLGILPMLFAVSNAYPQSTTGILAGFSMLGPFCVLGALIGIAVSFVVSGRRHLLLGAYLGALSVSVLILILPVVMFELQN